MFEHWGATVTEIASSMPGDDLIEKPAQEGTRAIDIMADRETVFGFLSQMGFGRAGWYSYDLLDNLGRRSATSINPEWLVKEAGASVPGGPIAFTAAVVERPSAYVLQLPQRGALGYRLDFTLAYRLDERTFDDGGIGTRLVSRAKVRIDGPGGRVVSKAVLLGDGVMVRRQLLGIKQRCEALAAGFDSLISSSAQGSTDA